MFCFQKYLFTLHVSILPFGSVGKHRTQWLGAIHARLISTLLGFVGSVVRQRFL